MTIINFHSSAMQSQRKSILKNREDIMLLLRENKENKKGNKKMICHFS